MRRYYWILMTMVKRPMAWVFVAAGILVAGGAIHFHFEKHSTKTPSVVRAGNIIESKQKLLDLVDHPSLMPVQIRIDRIANKDLHRFSREHDQDGNPRRVSGKEMESYYQQEIAYLPIPDDVVAMETGSWGTRMLPKLGKMKSLKRLEFEHAHANAPIDLSPLSNLENLEVLKLGYLQGIETLAPLQQLPKLHTLEIDHHDLVLRRERMAEVARLPALRTLYLPDCTKFEMSLEAISELNQSTTLKTVSPTRSTRGNQIRAVATAKY